MDKINKMVEEFTEKWIDMIDYGERLNPKIPEKVKGLDKEEMRADLVAIIEEAKNLPTPDTKDDLEIIAEEERR